MCQTHPGLLPSLIPWRPPLWALVIQRLQQVHSKIRVIQQFCCCLVIKSCLTLFATPWTIDHQTPLSIGFLSQEYWSGFAISFSRGSSRPKDWTQVSDIAGRFFTNWATREAPYTTVYDTFNMKTCYPCSWKFLVFLTDHHSPQTGPSPRFLPALLLASGHTQTQTGQAWPVCVALFLGSGRVPGNTFTSNVRTPRPGLTKLFPFQLTMCEFGNMVWIISIYYFVSTISNLEMATKLLPSQRKRVGEKLRTIQMGLTSLKSQ